MAPRDDDGQWRLYGRKWFTSAATSEMALTLARPEGNPGGARSLALFYLETCYVEDTGLPALLRDAQVLTIWEGTTNVLALDALRALAGEGVADALRAEVERCAAGVRHADLAAAADGAQEAIGTALVWLGETGGAEGGDDGAGGRAPLRAHAGRSLELLLLARQADWALDQGDRGPAAAVRRLVSDVRRPPHARVVAVTALRNGSSDPTTPRPFISLDRKVFHELRRFQRSTPPPFLPAPPAGCLRHTGRSTGSGADRRHR